MHKCKELLIFPAPFGKLYLFVMVFEKNLEYNPLATFQDCLNGLSGLNGLNGLNGLEKFRHYRYQCELLQEFFGFNNFRNGGSAMNLSEAMDMVARDERELQEKYLRLAEQEADPFVKAFFSRIVKDAAKHEKKVRKSMQSFCQR